MSAVTITALPGVPASLLGESPLWHPSEQTLYWCDIPGHKLNRFDPAAGVHRRWDFDTDVGCCAPLQGGGLLLALRSGLVRFDPSTGTSTPLAARALRRGERALQRRQGRSAGAFLGRHDLRAARPGARGAVSLQRGPARKDGRRHHGQQRPGVEPRRAHDVLGRHRGPRGLCLRLRRRRSQLVAAPRVRAIPDQGRRPVVARLRRPSRRRGRRLRRWLLGCDVRRRAPAALRARRQPDARDPVAGALSDHALLRRAGPEDAVHHHRAREATRPTNSRANPWRVACCSCASMCPACRRTLPSYDPPPKRLRRSPSRGRCQWTGKAGSTASA